MVVVRACFILATFVFCKCYTRRVPHEVMLNNKVMRLINSYIKPLSEKFPNHELEVQIDLQGPPLHHVRSGMSGRKVNKPTILRSGDASQWKNIPSLDYVGPVPQASRPNQYPHAKATYPPATKPSPTTVLTTKTTTKKEHTKEPVYKDELQKAMDNLEKKINKQLLKGPVGDQTLRDQIVVSNTGPVTGGSNPSISRLIELIRKGVQFQKHVPNTDDGNMEWMQIKIPKVLADLKTIHKK